MGQVFLSQPFNYTDMNKIREGNDFTLNWTIKMDDTTPLDTEGIYDEELYLIYFGREVNIKAFERTDNTILVEVTPALAPVVGDYTLEWHFKKPNPNYYRGYQNRVFDAPVFKIVPSSSEEDGLRNIEVITVLNG